MKFYFTAFIYLFFDQNRRYGPQLTLSWAPLWITSAFSVTRRS